MTPNVEAVVICEDVRQEVTGKHTLIGVFGGDMILSRLPLNLRIAWWLQVGAEAGVYTLQFRALGPGEAQLFEANVQMQANDSRTSGLALPPVQVQLQREGELQLQWRDAAPNAPDAPWTTIKTVNVVRAKAPQQKPANLQPPNGIKSK